MKIVLCLLALLSSRLFATAPDSLAGKVYRDYQLLSGVSNADEVTLILGTDGRFTRLLGAIGVKESSSTSASTGLPDAHWGAIAGGGAQTDGSYQYQKTGTSTGVLTRTLDGSTTVETSTLYFTSANTGSTSTSGLAGAGGDAFYLTDLQPGGSSPAIANISSRGRVTEGHPLVVGIVIPGITEREVLIRVIGPALTTFGVTDAWTNTHLQIYGKNGAIFGDAFVFPHWSDIPVGLFQGSAGMTSPEVGLRKIFGYLGAFPLTSGSKDCAVVIRLAPGSYTAVATAAAGDAGGEALVEAYFLP